MEVIVRGRSFSSLSKAAKFYGISYAVIYNRINKLNWTISEAFGVNRISDFKGKKYKSVKEMAEQYNLPPNIVRIRLNKGWDIKSALTTPLRKYVKSENFR